MATNNDIAFEEWKKLVLHNIGLYHKCREARFNPILEGGSPTLEACLNYTAIRESLAELIQAHAASVIHNGVVYTPVKYYPDPNWTLDVRPTVSL